nr:FecR family protein [Pedobacter sp. ASV2]
MLANQKIKLLLNKYTEGICSTAELDELVRYASTNEYDTILKDHILNNLQSSDLPGENFSDNRSEVILQKIFLSIRKKKNTTHKLVFNKLAVKITIAASLFLAIFVGIKYFISETPNYYLTNVKTLTGKTKYLSNNSERALKLHLEDGSIIILQPHAELTYPEHFAVENRKVYLHGAAFFEVAKNHKRPFLVYHENLITKVLGTSFNISFDKKTNKTEVNVRTGKVQVYENIKFKAPGIAARGVIILPNQRVIYIEDKKSFNKTLVEQPTPILPNTIAKTNKNLNYNFEFESSPLTTIIPMLQDTYGISIKLENENFRRCLFTGDLSDQNLFSRLDILCKAVNASYEVKGTEIVIKGKGCN